MPKAKVPYMAKSHVDSGIIVQLADVIDSSVTVIPNSSYPGVAVVLPPPPPTSVEEPNPLQNTVVAYIGRFVGTTTVSIPGDWSQVFLLYLPNGIGTPPGFKTVYDAITAAIDGGSSPPPGDGTTDG
jgi:hypothetical protein